MRDETVARSYAETLFDLALRHEGLAAFAEGLGLVVGQLEEDPVFRLFLETPRIAAREKKDVVRKAFGPAIPPRLLSFLLVTIDKRRQRLLRAIAGQFSMLVDEHEGRAHVEVTVARPVDQVTRDSIANRLSAMLGKTAIPHMKVEPRILGGVIVRAGDTLYDGSVRRRLEGLRRRLIASALPSGSGG